MGNEAILHVFFVIFIDESDLRLKMKKYGNEAILHVFFDIFIHESQANLRLKWKKWEIFVLCILIDTHEIANQKKTI
jgi:hypothetical protein